MLRGSQNIALAMVAGLTVPVRALGTGELVECDRCARRELIGAGVDDDDGLRAELALKRALERAVLDPDALRRGEERSLFVRSDLGELPGQAVGALIDAFVRATSLARPDIDPTALYGALVARIGELDRARASMLGPSGFFGQPDERLTEWQFYFYAACRRSEAR